METPAVEQFLAHEQEWNTLVTFMNWLELKGVILCKEYQFENELRPLDVSHEQWIADYFGINLVALTTEKQALLEEKLQAIRKRQT